MFWYDEFRIRTFIIRNRWKENLAKILVKILCKLSPGVFNKTVIDRKIVIDISQYIPFDNKWHHFCFTTDFWGKYKKDKKQMKKLLKQELICYLDGKKVRRKK
jgi:hypothetical protein